MSNRLDSIPGRDRQYRRVTDGQTDILPRHSPRYAYASRGNYFSSAHKVKSAGKFSSLCSSCFP